MDCHKGLKNLFSQLQGPKPLDKPFRGSRWKGGAFGIRITMDTQPKVAANAARVATQSRLGPDHSATAHCAQGTPQTRRQEDRAVRQLSTTVVDNCLSDGTSLGTRSHSDCYREGLGILFVRCVMCAMMREDDQGSRTRTCHGSWRGRMIFMKHPMHCLFYVHVVTKSSDNTMTIVMTKSSDNAMIRLKQLGELRRMFD